MVEEGGAEDALGADEGEGHRGDGGEGAGGDGDCGRSEGDRSFEGVGGEVAEAGEEVLAASGRWERLVQAAVEVGELGAGIEDHPNGLTGDGDLDDRGDHRAVEGEGDSVEIVLAFVHPHFVSCRVDDGVVGSEGVGADEAVEVGADVAAHLLEADAEVVAGRGVAVAGERHGGLGVDAGRRAGVEKEAPPLAVEDEVAIDHGVRVDVTGGHELASIHRGIFAARALNGSQFQGRLLDCYEAARRLEAASSHVWDDLRGYCNDGNFYVSDAGVRARFRRHDRNSQTSDR